MKGLKEHARSLKLILLTLIVLSAAGCSQKYAKPQLPSNLKHCPELKVFNGVDLNDLIFYTLNLVADYKDCNAKSEAKNIGYDYPSQ